MKWNRGPLGNWPWRPKPTSCASDLRRLRRCHLVTRLRARHLRDGASYVVATRLNGEAWLRCTFMNPLTELEDMQTMLDEFERWMAED